MCQLEERHLHALLMLSVIGAGGVAAETRCWVQNLVQAVMCQLEEEHLHALLMLANPQQSAKMSAGVQDRAGSHVPAAGGAPARAADAVSACGC